jgi:ribosome-binding protein aMBF1 (putative translation factor)
MKHLSAKASLKKEIVLAQWDAEGQPLSIPSSSTSIDGVSVSRSQERREKHLQNQAKRRRLLGLILCEARQECRLEYHVICDAVGISRQVLRRIERGKATYLDTEIIDKLRKFYRSVEEC